MPIDPLISRRLGLLLLSSLLIGLFVLGHQPISVNLFKPPGDKIAHFCTFALIAVCIQMAWPRISWPFTLLLSSLIGCLDEIHQTFVPGRHAGWDDGLADFLGASLGLMAWSFSPWKTR